MTKQYTSWERVGAILAGEEPDRVPFALVALTIGARWAGPNYTSAPVPKFARDPEYQARGAIGLYKWIGMDLCTPVSDVAQYSEPWGVETKLIEPTPRYPETTPLITKHAAKTPEEFAALKTWTSDTLLDPKKGKGAWVNLIANKIAVKEVGDKVPVAYYSFSTLTTSTHVAYMADLMKWIITNPKEVKEGMKAITASRILEMKMHYENGVRAIIFCTTRATGEVVTLKTWREFGMPYDVEFLKAMPKDMVAICHTCGREPYIDEMIKAFKPTGRYVAHNWWDRGSIYDMNYAVKTWKRDITIVGGLDQTRTMLFGTPYDVARECKDAIQKAASGGKFILCTGCEIPAISPEENLRAIPAAVEKWGRYPITAGRFVE